MTDPLPPSGGHAFVSYVHEDAERVDALVTFLEASGIRVWRDSEQLWPGDDWKIEIRRAIERDSLAFVACFSTSAAERETTYQNEELVVAAEQFRLRRPGRPWLFPVRFDECEIPAFDLGAGRTLDSLQRSDLFGEGREPALARLASGIRRVLDDGSDSSKASSNDAPPTAASPDASSGTATVSLPNLMKQLLRDPARDIELDDLVTNLADSALAQLRDEVEFPTSSDAMQTPLTAAREIARRVERYWELTSPVAEALAVGCAWGITSEQDALWARTMRAIASSITIESGNTALLELRLYPTIVSLYSGAIAAVAREHWSALRAITTDAKIRKDGHSIPVIGVCHIWRPFSTFSLGAQVAARIPGDAMTDDAILAVAAGRSGVRYTPVSDHLHAQLRATLRPVIRDDADYDEIFDAAELMLALIAADAQIQRRAQDVYLSGPWFGRYLWRDRHLRSGRTPDRLRAELESQAHGWKPLLGGLFGGSEDRAQAAFDLFYTEYETAHSRAAF